VDLGGEEEYDIRILLQLFSELYYSSICSGISNRDSDFGAMLKN
jgi:hypothetical protein